MAYTDQKMSGGKVTAIIIVALIHLALGYAFVTGLAYQYVKKAQEKLNTFDVAPPPPPPPDVPPPPIVNVPTPPTVVIQSVPTPPKVYIPTPIAAPPAPPSPAPPARTASQAAGLKGNPGQFFGDDAYPAAAIRAEAQGRVVAKLSVGTDGRVTDCTVTTSSGNSDLDSTTCRIAKSRVRFTPAKDDAGQPIASTFTLPVRWVLPKN